MLKKIKKIEYLDKEVDVYDISVQDNHNFFANGALVHNCHNYGTDRLRPYLSSDLWKYKIGLSATVTRGDNKHLDIIKLFNYNVFKYTPKQAINEGVLNPFNFSDIAIEMDSTTLEKYTELTKQLNLILKAGGGFMRIMKSGTVELRNAMLSKMNERKQLVNNYPRKFDVVKFIVEKHKDDKILVFSQFNDQTNKIYWYLLDIGIKARIIHSGITKEKRDQALTDFRNDKFNVLLTTKVLDEGVNLPKISCAIITASDSTTRQTIQRMGRVLRKKEENSNLFQLFCKDTMEEEQAIKRTAYFKDLSSRFNYYFYRITDKSIW
jgi:superfamily II DNA or RNA helicase